MKINAIVASQQRAFAKRGRKKKNDEGVTTDEEIIHEEVAHEEAPVQEPTSTMSSADLSAAKQTNFKEVSRDLFVPFSLGDVKQVNSTPDHKPPTQDDTIDGRYASVLFTSASQQESLYAIYEDFTYIKALYDNSEQFRLFTMNAGIGIREIQ